MSFAQQRELDKDSREDIVLNAVSISLIFERIHHNPFSGQVSCFRGFFCDSLFIVVPMCDQVHGLETIFQLC